MLKKSAAVVLMCSSSMAFAEWRDVEYSATLPADAVYCTSQSNLEEFAGFAQDGDNQGANRMISEGDCRVSTGMKIQVFQENEFASSFLSPSGKAFNTLTGFIEK